MEESDFIRAILSNTRDHAGWLIYADWLAEQGRGADEKAVREKVAWSARLDYPLKEGEVSECLGVRTMLGLIMSRVWRDDGGRTENEGLVFQSSDGTRFILRHQQDCCESVTIEDIEGRLEDLVGSPLLQAEESTSDKQPDDVPEPEYEPESQTWTFYKFATAKGYVTVRFFGQSNGYYSESVSLMIERPSDTKDDD